jgi:predicted membrane-bound dolichyl-phosphate-mannose-protein mannosyltransferase
MEYKLKNHYKLYPKNGESKEVCTIVFDDERFNNAQVQRELAVFMNKMALKMFANINASTTNDVTAIQNKEKTIEDEILEYKATGFNLFSFLEENQAERILHSMLRTGCLYCETAVDLARSDEFVDKIDIVDIYVILGYYFLNFTVKQLV